MVRLCDEDTDFRYSYQLEESLEGKIKNIAGRVYRADGVNILAKAEKQIRELEKLGFGRLPVCMAKTQYSFSDDPGLLGAPKALRLQ